MIKNNKEWMVERNRILRERRESNLLNSEKFKTESNQNFSEKVGPVAEELCSNEASEPEEAPGSEGVPKLGDLPKLTGIQRIQDENDRDKHSVRELSEAEKQDNEEREAQVNSYVGKLIRKMRKEKGLSKTELGDLIGKSNHQIRHFEQGLRTPKFMNLINIFESLGYRLEIDLKEVEKEKSEHQNQTENG